MLSVPRAEIHKELIVQGIPVRLYVPYSTHWDHAYAYLRRRMYENHSMIFYVLRNLVYRFFKWLKRPFG